MNRALIIEHLPSSRRCLVTAHDLRGQRAIANIACGARKKCVTPASSRRIAVERMVVQTNVTRLDGGDDHIRAVQHEARVNRTITAGRPANCQENTASGFRCVAMNEGWRAPPFCRTRIIVWNWIELPRRCAVRTGQSGANPLRPTRPRRPRAPPGVAGAVTDASCDAARGCRQRHASSVPRAAPLPCLPARGAVRTPCRSLPKRAHRRIAQPGAACAVAANDVAGSSRQIPIPSRAEASAQAMITLAWSTLTPRPVYDPNLPR
jgi:hypothetical protein